MEPHSFITKYLLNTNDVLGALGTVLSKNGGSLSFRREKGSPANISWGRVQLCYLPQKGTLNSKGIHREAFLRR